MIEQRMAGDIFVARAISPFPFHHSVHCYGSVNSLGKWLFAS